MQLNQRDIIGSEFFEVQRILKTNNIAKYISLLAIAVLLWSWYIGLTTFIAGKTPLYFFILYSIFTVYLILLFDLFKLVTVINSESIRIYFYFFPFNVKRIFLWEEIKICRIRTYKPIAEYGGWGIRTGGSSGTAYNVSGNIGLQLELTNKKRILIGTQKPDEIKSFLNCLNR